MKHNNGQNKIMAEKQNEFKKGRKWVKIREFTIATPTSYRTMTDPVITTVLHSGPIKRKYCQEYLKYSKILKNTTVRS